MAGIAIAATLALGTLGTASAVVHDNGTSNQQVPTRRRT